MNEKTVGIEDIRTAQAAIENTVVRTGLQESEKLSKIGGCRVFLKPECNQTTGSFKIRGAANKMASLSEDEKARGVVTASSGNHGRATAYVGGRMGISATICMSKWVPANKVDAIRGYGANVELAGSSYDEAERRAFEIRDKHGMTFVSAFDDPFIIAGQGTVGLEMFDENPKLETLLVPLSGGGLISGVALAAKALKSSVQVIGVSMDRAPMMHLSLIAGHPVEVKEEETLADALMGSIGVENRYTFGIVKELVDRTVLVSEEEIFEAMGFLCLEHGLIVEGGGAVAAAAVLHGKVENMGNNAAIVLSGGNVKEETVTRAVEVYSTQSAK